MKRYFLTLVLALALALMGCFETQVAEPGKEGNGSETVALVSGKVVNKNGNAVVGARVTLISEKYNPIKSNSSELINTTSNTQGNYEFHDIPKGVYNVEAKNLNDGMRSFTQLGRLEKSTTNKADTVKPTGNIHVTFSDSLNHSGGYYYLPHTPYLVQVTEKILSQGYLDLDSIPTGQYGSLVYAKDTTVQGDTLGSSLSIQSGATHNVDGYAAWKYNGTISIAVGSLKLTSDAVHLPILLRLDSSNFDFSQAQTQLEDIRFMTSVGTPLAFQIDHIDALKKQASLWVAVDSILKSSTTLSFKMVWGNASAKAKSNGKAVFDTSAGYVGVWHLDESMAGSGNANVYQNSATSVDNGLDSVLSAGQAGLIGNGVNLQSGEYIRVPNASAAMILKNGLTLSAWVKTSGNGNLLGEDIANYGDNYGIRLLANGDANIFSTNYPDLDSNICRYNTSNNHLLDNAWHQIVGTINGNRYELFVDGILQGGTDCTRGPILFNGAKDFLIGRHGMGAPNFNFVGSIDEVRLFPGVLSAAAIKVGYETQKPSASVVSLIK